MKGERRNIRGLTDEELRAMTARLRARLEECDDERVRRLIMLDAAASGLRTVRTRQDKLHALTQKPPGAGARGPEEDAWIDDAT